MTLKHWIEDRRELVAHAAFVEERNRGLIERLYAKHEAMLSASERSERLAGENKELASRLDRIVATADTRSPNATVKRIREIALGQDKLREQLRASVGAS